MAKGALESARRHRRRWSVDRYEWATLAHRTRREPCRVSFPRLISLMATSTAERPSVAPVAGTPKMRRWVMGCAAGADRWPNTSLGQLRYQRLVSTGLSSSDASFDFFKIGGLAEGRVCASARNARGCERVPFALPSPGAHNRRLHAIDAFTPASTASTASVAISSRPPPGGSHAARPICFVRKRWLKIPSRYAFKQNPKMLA